MNNAGMQAENGKVIATAANIPRRSHTRPSAMVRTACYAAHAERTPIGVALKGQQGRARLSSLKRWFQDMALLRLEALSASQHGQTAPPARE